MRKCALAVDAVKECHGPLHAAHELPPSGSPPWIQNPIWILFLYLSTQVGPSPDSLLGFKPSLLTGHCLTDLIDVFAELHTSVH